MGPPGSDGGVAGEFADLRTQGRRVVRGGHDGLHRGVAAVDERCQQARCGELRRASAAVPVADLGAVLAGEILHDRAQAGGHLTEEPTAAWPTPPASGRTPGAEALEVVVGAIEAELRAELGPVRPVTWTAMTVSVMSVVSGSAVRPVRRARPAGSAGPTTATLAPPLGDVLAEGGADRCPDLVQVDADGTQRLAVIVKTA